MAEFGPIKRHWQSNEDNSKIRCYLPITGNVTLMELVEYLAANHPETTLRGTVLHNAGPVTWLEPPTDSELIIREQDRRRQAERLDKWERETYERLKAKFDAPSSTNPQAPVDNPPQDQPGL